MKPAELLPLARTDLAVFAALVWPEFELAPHVKLLVSALEQVERGEQRRLMVSMPPRHGKSLLCSTLLPAWALGRNPLRLLIGASHSQELADTFGRRVRNLLLDDRFRAAFPGCRLSEDSAAASRFDTDGGGSYFGIGRGGGLTGRGGDLIVIDDPLKDAQEASSPGIRQQLKDWYSAVVYTRLQPGGAVVIVTTRWSLDDLSGWLLREHRDEGWRLISLPALAEPGDALGRAEGEALWPSRFPVPVLERTRAQLGSRAWLALYQGRPVPEGGAIFKTEWFATYREAPQFERVVQAWDTSFGKGGADNDFSACVTVGATKSDFFVLDVTRGRWSFPELQRRMAGLAEWFSPTEIVVEDVGSGTSLLQVLRGETTLPLHAVKPEGSKDFRAQLVSPLCEARKVHLPEVSSWKAAFLDELLTFPQAAHDDMVDAFVHALTRLRQRRGC
jgi:predicted phage terminase large subunit-like protein